ncbi:MAG: bifunctional phosphoribosylaminoimidazolecarboxamide formyltransferase/IMP cyclohydrolase [Miniphocaeibacter sp.]|uniref:bifunctional phosphoribosylaminoimidazolecarboxamide formyltransferase/IMP cyclohydrolase n=1 Tax=Miniphocaeibacter sp. TaxID=3100973 RepID=UPI001796B164|nr:bifunctional phosphoribosylaminoimidazolecarboxamide formyltransferase/IMP cyclohydrolase [Gallicola sp.]
MKTALISVYKKEGIVDFVKGLTELGWNIVSTGGTYKHLLDNGIDVTDITDITNFPEILNGRVKTLHPKVYGGILYRRDVEEHVNTIEEQKINSIDMVVNTLYPFEETINDINSTHEELIEKIDIGGPSMIRAAAKNYKDVIVVTSTLDYDFVLKELKEKGDLTLDNKRILAGKAFGTTAQYDALISNYFNNQNKVDFPENITFTYRLKQNLRYGENPHQNAAFYEKIYEVPEEKGDIVQLHGKELSYNNLNDLYGAVKMVKEFEDPTAVAVKHNNPCGIASGENIYEAFKKAYEADEVSIFGGIISLNRKVDVETANLLSQIFLEIVVAPDYEEEAFNILSKKKNIRILQIKNLNTLELVKQETKDVLHGVLLQDRDNKLLKEQLDFVTNRKPTDEELEELLFAWKAVKYVNSNGVVISKDKQTLAIGQGEVRRHWAVEKAVNRSIKDLHGAVLASDGFFFGDTVEELNKAGVKAIIQPGGSVKDKEVIELANKYDIAVVFTGMRHFKH